MQKQKHMGFKHTTTKQQNSHSERMNIASSYTAAKHDTWQRISAKSGVPVAVLQKVNNNTKLKAGVSVRIPGGGVSPAAAQIARGTPASVKKKGETSPVVAARKGAHAPNRPGAALEETPQAASAKGKRAPKADITPAPDKDSGVETEGFYVAKPGDTVYSIARNYGADVDSVLRANQLDSPRQLRAGQKLRIPGALGAPTAAAHAKPHDVQGNTDGHSKANKPEVKSRAATVAVAAPNAGTYRVQAGDTMWSIARKHNLPPRELMRINQIDESTTLRPGATIKVALK